MVWSNGSVPSGTRAGKGRSVSRPTGEQSMSQNIISLTFTEAQITALDAALTELETQLSGCIALDLTKKRALKKMGEKSEAFCRQALHMAELNPQMMPANIPVADAVAD